jgi:hypothetical protein
MFAVAQSHAAHFCRKRISYDTGIRGGRQLRNKTQSIVDQRKEAPNRASQGVLE